MKLIFSFFIPALSCMLIYCGARNHTDNKEKDSTNIKIPGNAVPADSLEALSTKRVEINAVSILEVKSMNLALDETIPDDSMLMECKKWKLTAASIKDILKNGAPISMHELSYLYYVLPCEVKGLIEIDSALFSYSVNAGSYFTISNKDTTFFYGCNASACKKYFLMEGGDPKRDIE